MEITIVRLDNGYMVKNVGCGYLSPARRTGGIYCAALDEIPTALEKVMTAFDERQKTELEQRIEQIAELEQAAKG